MIVPALEGLDRGVSDRTAGRIDSVRRVSPAPERIDVPVEGGTLAAYRWSGDGPLVLAAHGITSNHRSWGLVAEALAGDATLVAPDLRGRGRSNELPGPYTVARHADDCAALLDHLGADRRRRHRPLDGRLRRDRARHPPPGARARRRARRRRPAARDPGRRGPRRRARRDARPGDAAARHDLRGPRRLPRVLAAAPVVRGHLVERGRRARPARPDRRGARDALLLLQGGRHGQRPRADRRRGRAHRGARRAVPARCCCGRRAGWSTTPAGCTRRSGWAAWSTSCVPDTNHYSILLGAPGAKRVAAAIRRAL